MIGIALGVIGGLMGFSALKGFLDNEDDKKKRPRGYTPASATAMLAPLGPPPKATTPEQLTFLKDIIVKMALKQSISSAERSQAISIAANAGLAKTAQAIQSESRLPLDEKWPGTGMSILDYIKSLIGL